MNLLRSWLFLFAGLNLRCCVSSSKQQQSSVADNSVKNYDNRIGVGDQGILAGDGANVGNDNRTFDDHSSLSIVSTDSRDMSDRSTTIDGRDMSTTAIDSRDFSDRSSFSSVDNSVTNTNITTLDGDISKRAIEAVENAGRSLADAVKQATVSSQAVSLRALDGQGAAVSDALGFGRTALGLSHGTADTAIEFARSTQAAFAKSADDTRDFVGEFAGKVLETAKSSDQQTTEKVVKAATIISAIVALYAVASKFASRSKAA